MDTTPEYIKMCEKAREIQELNEEMQDGNYYKYKNKEYSGLYDFIEKPYCDSCVECNYANSMTGYITEQDRSNYIWLPRQDQLQEMIKGNLIYSSLWDGDASTLWFDRMNSLWQDTLIHNKSLHWTKFRSMEQLWLAFVMKEKYNKIWDGKEWN